jgi:hypothetical protein
MSNVAVRRSAPLEATGRGTDQQQAGDGQTIEAVTGHQYTWYGGMLVRLAIARTGS